MRTTGSRKCTIAPQRGRAAPLWAAMVTAASVAAEAEPALAAPAPPPGGAVRVEPPADAAVPPDITLRAPGGESLPTAALFGQGRPVVMVLAYSECAMLCSLVLRGLADAVAEAAARPGVDYDVVTVSIDPDERPDIARRTRTKLRSVAGLPASSDGWRYLLGEERQIRRLAAALGFHYRYDERTEQYAHPAAVFVLADDGALAGVLRSIRHEPGALDEAVRAASEGRPVTPAGVDRVVDAVLRCFRFEPSDRKYGGLIAGGLRLVGVSLVLGLGLVVFGVARRRGR